MLRSDQRERLVKLKALFILVSVSGVARPGLTKYIVFLMRFDRPHDTVCGQRIMDVISGDGT